MERHGGRADGGHTLVGHAQRLAAAGAGHAFQQAGSQQVGLQHVLAGPAGRSVHLPQALVVAAGQLHAGMVAGGARQRCVQRGME